MSLLENCELTQKVRAPWTLEEAIPLLREVENVLIPLGYHCALGGSVLHSGHSDKDLDVFIYPHDSDKVLTPEEILGELYGVFGGLCSGRCNPEYLPRDAKEVFWSYNGKDQRVDFFFLK